MLQVVVSLVVDPLLLVDCTGKLNSSKEKHNVRVIAARLATCFASYSDLPHDVASISGPFSLDLLILSVHSMVFY